MLCTVLSRSIMSDSLWPFGLYLACQAPLSLEFSPGKIIGVSYYALLQGIFPTQGSNLGLPHCRQILYLLSQQGSPRILVWVACPFSRGSSWPRSQKRVSHIAGRFLISWATREAHKVIIWPNNSISGQITNRTRNIYLHKNMHSGGS